MKAARLLAASGAAVAALALPGAASAATATSDVTGTVGSEVSVSAPDVTLSSFSPSTDGTGSSVVSVTSTLASWNLTLHDAALTTPGQMDKVDCTTRVLATGSLASALAFSGPAGSGSVSAAAAAVRTGGASSEDVTVSFTQGIGATEDVVVNNCYEMQLTFTAT